MADEALDRRARKKLATRDAIRAAGITLFTEKGYAETSLQDIADAADVGRRTIYQHFETKEDLLLVEVRQFLAEMEELLERCPQDLSPLDCYFEANDELRRRWAEWPSASAIPIKQLYEIGGSEPVISARFRLVVHQHVERLQALFADRLGVDPWDVKLCLLAELSGIALTGSLAIYTLGRTTSDIFALREEILTHLGNGLDPAAVERRRQQLDTSG